jgi:hypothetical protein
MNVRLPLLFALLALVSVGAAEPAAPTKEKEPSKKGWAGGHPDTAKGRADEPVSAEKLYQEARRYRDELRDKEIAGPKKRDGIETEDDLLGAIASGEITADQAFCVRIDLAAATQSLLPLLDSPAPSPSKENAFKIAQGMQAAGKLFIARGQQLCQQGKDSEGRVWFLRTHALARKCGGDQSLIQLLTAVYLENFAQSAAACYIEVWTKAERLEYVEKLNALRPLPDLETAAANDWKLFAPAGSSFLRILVPGAGERDKQMKANLLRTERRAIALKLALRYGAELEADQVGLLTDADGKALKLGESFTLKRKAILGQPLFRRDAKEPQRDESEYLPSDFLVIGPIK